MAPILFRFLACGHLEKDPKVHELWRKLQERSALPQSLTVKSGLPCRHCSQSQVTYYTDISEWLYGTYKTGNKDNADMLAELIWVRSALEQQHPGLPEAKAMCALLALAACRLRERHADDLVSQATQLVDSLSVGSKMNKDDDGGVAAINRTATIDNHEAEQVKLIKCMDHTVDSIIGVVVALREVVARAEASPRYLPEYDSWKQELPSRKIFGLF
ncbi:uncharacterized protein PG998_005395 [Apiospora kogelbergensis]|uniref:uncharacterized protein n=1 Tax=Apiospora kogelbergensis TaxID=1337665 RepID=UPI0031324228